jgi:penicillin-insensitive murein DD-endopeptidase
MRFPTLLLSVMLGLAALAAAPLAAPALRAIQVAAQSSGETMLAAATGTREQAAGKRAKRKPEARKAASKAAKPKPTPAKELFGAAKSPAPLAARSIGFYAKGCLAGAAALPIDGPAWQAMRLSRNRNWGHPDLIALLERFAGDVKAHDGWPGLLVGDISQPRGGPMSSGHASHQVGLDADVWFTPMPDRRLTETEREDISATSMLAADSVSVDPKIWTDAHVRILKRAASYPQVERVLVHPAIKKAVCEATAKDKGADRTWLNKVRPYWGHYYHFHIRIACPKGSSQCEHQPAVGGDDGCGAELTRWLKLIKPPPVAATPPPPKPAVPAPERRPITLDQLPAECRAVLASGTPPLAKPPAAPDKADKTDKPMYEMPAEKAAATPAPAAKEAAATKPASATPPGKPAAPAAAKPAPDGKQTKPAAAKAQPLYD